MFTHLKLCLADAILNFKWGKIIQIRPKWRSTIYKSCWLMSRFILNMLKRGYVLLICWYINRKPNIIGSGHQRDKRAIHMCHPHAPQTLNQHLNERYWLWAGHLKWEMFHQCQANHYMGQLMRTVASATACYHQWCVPVWLLNIRYFPFK